ncbi:MAG: hypothetical protein ACJ8AI_10640 [Rhodopila sp.]
MPKTARTSSTPRRPAHRPPHVPTKADRDTAAVMVAGGIAQADIARARGISEPTLRKHYREELDSGQTVLNTVVLIEWVKRIKAGDFQAIKWWTQSRMNFSEKITVDDPARNQPLRVVVELVGSPAPAAAPVTNAEAPRNSPRLPGTLVQFRG